MSSDRVSNWHLQTSGGIKYALMEGYPKIRASTGGEGASATEQYLMRATDVPAFIAESFGTVSDLIGNLLLPNHRTMPGVPAFVTQTIDAEPFTGDLPADPFSQESNTDFLGSYDDLMRVTVEYETELQDSTGPDGTNRDPDQLDTFLELDVTGGLEYLNIPPRQVQVEGGDVNDATNEANRKANEDQDLAITKITPVIEYTYTWARAHKPDFEAIIEHLGAVNDRKYVNLFLNAEPETVLFTGFSAKRNYVWLGTVRGLEWFLQFNFSQRTSKTVDAKLDSNGDIEEDAAGNEIKEVNHYGWNHVYVPHDGKWERIWINDGPADDGNRRNLYDKRDLRNIFGSEDNSRRFLNI